jgi:hypothetical protein
MKCSNPDCDGKINDDIRIESMTGSGGCSSTIEGNAYPCDKCGRLHWFGGSPVQHEGKSVFLIGNKIVYK